MRLLKQYSWVILKKHPTKQKPLSLPNTAFDNTWDLIKKKAKHTVAENMIAIFTSEAPNQKAFPGPLLCPSKPRRC